MICFYQWSHITYFCCCYPELLKSNFMHVKPQCENRSGLFLIVISEKECLSCSSYLSIWTLGFDSMHVAYIEFLDARHLTTITLEADNIWSLLLSLSISLQKNKNACLLFLKNRLKIFMESKRKFWEFESLPILNTESGSQLPF